MSFFTLAQTNPFADLEDSLYQTIVQIQGAWFTSSWYGTWLLIIGTFTAFFFIYSVGFKSFYLWASNKPGVIREVIVQYLTGLIIIICVINVHVFVDFLFTLFLLFVDFGNQLLSGTANTAIDILQLINDTAAAIQAQTFDPLAIIYGLSWFTLMFGVVLMGVIYVINLGEAVFYLFVVFPFLCRAGLMGLLLPQTSGWFPTITNLALQQLMKPLLGKVFFWLTLIMLQIGFNRITDTTAGVQTLISQIAWLLFVITFGVIMQFRVPDIAKTFAIATGAVAGNITSSGLGESLLRLGSAGAKVLGRSLNSVASSRLIPPRVALAGGRGKALTTGSSGKSKSSGAGPESSGNGSSNPFKSAVARDAGRLGRAYPALDPLTRRIRNQLTPVERNVFAPNSKRGPNTPSRQPIFRNDGRGGGGTVPNPLTPGAPKPAQPRRPYRNPFTPGNNP